MKKTRKFQGIFFNSVFLLLGIMAVFLYKERLFADAAYYAFYLINDAWFHVEQGRLVLAVGQFIPLLGYFIGLPLKVLMVLSSLSHELVFYAIFLLLFYGLKDTAASYLLLFVHLIGQLWMYYSPMYEITYGAAFAVLFYAILRSPKVKDDKWLILLLVAQWLVMTSHPENFILLIFVLVYDFLEKGWRKRIHTIALSVFAIGAVVKALRLSAYEKGNIENSFNEGATMLNLFNGQYWGKLADFFLPHFPELVVFTLLVLLFFLFKKQFLKMGLLIGAIAVMLIVVNHKAYTDEFNPYFESMYNPLVFLASFVIIYGVYDKLKGNAKLMFAFVFSLVILGRIYWIWDFGEPLRQRMTQMERTVDYLQTFEQSKFLINQENYERAYTNYTWANPIEALLFSAMDGKDETISLVSNRDMDFVEEHSKMPTKNEFILRRYEVKANDFLNERYFQLPAEHYVSVNKIDYQESPDEMRSMLTLKPYQRVVLNFSAGDTTYLPVLVKSAEKMPIPSKIPTQTFLSYHWYKDGESVVWDGLRTPLEVDVYNAYVQDIRLAVPKEAGSYELQLDVVIEGKMWFELPKRFKVSVVP